MTSPVTSLQNELLRDYYKRYPSEILIQLESADPDGLQELLERIPADLAVLWIQRITPAKAGSVLPKLSHSLRDELVINGDLNRVSALVASLSKPERDTFLAKLTPEIRAEIETLTQYPVTSAGRLMDTRAVTLRPDATVTEATARVRAAAPRRIQDLFVVDEEGHVQGWIAVEDLIPAAANTPVSELNRGMVPTVQAVSAKEEALELLEKFRLRTIPVVDFDGRLLGVLRQEQLIEAAQEQIADDLLTMVGAGREEKALSSPALAVKKRLPWLHINLVTAFLAAAVVGLFEGTIARFTALAILLPVVAGQSGNTGAQALAVTMRGIALREVRVRQWLRVAIKEVSVGAINGVAVALTTSVAVYIWSGSFGLSLVIGTSMILSMTIAGFSGAVIPVVLTRLGQDPAQSSTIILTTVTDVVGFFTFLGIATMLAGMLAGA